MNKKCSALARIAGEMLRIYGWCVQFKCNRNGTHVARHGVYRGLPLCAQHHEGPRKDEI